MIEVKFTFEDDFEGREKAMAALSSDRMASLLFDIKHNLWRKWKHSEDDLNVDTLQDAISALFEDYDIDINTLTS
jgi:hypothetical protein